jgi:hypothetical protein
MSRYFHHSNILLATQNVNIYIYIYIYIYINNYVIFLAWYNTKEATCNKDCGGDATKNLTRLCTHTKNRCLSEYEPDNEKYETYGPLSEDETFSSPCYLNPCTGVKTSEKL